MLNPKIAFDTLNAALETGADFAELYIEETYLKATEVENGVFFNNTKNSVFGIGLRIIKNDQVIYGDTTAKDAESLINLARSLSKAFTGKKKTCKQFKPIETSPSVNKKNLTKNIEDKRIFNFIKQISSYIKNKYKRINRNVISFAITDKEKEIFNSNGIHTLDFIERSRLGMSVYAKKGDKIESDFQGPGTCGDFTFFEQYNWKETADKICRNAILNLDAKECPSGKMPVVIGNGFGGVLFHEACGHSLEGTSVSVNSSVFCNKLNTQIASKLLTVYEDGTIKNEWGSIDFDDEGNKSQKICLIEKGVLKNYILDEYTAKKLKLKANGKCRRQNYTYVPTSRMTNTYIDNGTSNPKDIIKNTKLGLYAKNMGGGSVNPATGEFNFGVSEAYIIRNGKICERVRGALLIGHGEEILKKIDMVGNDLTLSQGVCGSSSGHVPVCVGQPTLRISEILVGGTGGKLK